MRNSIYLLVLTLIFLGCKENNEPKKSELNNHSNFNLKNDYAQLTKKMTNSDTIEISTDLSICTWERQETMQITKSDDCLKIDLTINDADYETQHQIFKISNNDSIWKIGKYLKRNENRLKSPKPDSYPRMIIFNKKDTLKYYSDGLIDSNKFIADYYKLMYQIDPTNEIYNYAFQQDSIN